MAKFWSERGSGKENQRFETNQTSQTKCWKYSNKGKGEINCERKWKESFENSASLGFDGARQLWIVVGLLGVVAVEVSQLPTSRNRQKTPRALKRVRPPLSPSLSHSFFLIYSSSPRILSYSPIAKVSGATIVCSRQPHVVIWPTLPAAWRPTKIHQRLEIGMQN